MSRNSEFGAVVAAIPLLLFRLALSLLRIKARRRKGVKVFRRQLEDSGLAAWQVKEIVIRYEQFGRIRSYLGSGLPGFLFLRS